MEQGEGWDRGVGQANSDRRSGARPDEPEMTCSFLLFFFFLNNFFSSSHNNFFVGSIGSIVSSPYKNTTP